MRYAATLLHDPRRRMEGIQRLAELVERGDIPPECKYWWGRALMYEGEGQLAIKYLEEAQSEGDKTEFWREHCSLAILQSGSLPAGFDTRYTFVKLGAMGVPIDTYYRFVQWKREGTRLMIAPENISSKLDKKRRVLAPMVFTSGNNRVFYHRLGKK